MWSFASLCLFIGLVTGADRPQGQLRYGRANYTSPARFPYEIYQAYYNTTAGQQPQPIIINPETDLPYPLSLTNPDTIPTINLVDPVIYPNVTRGSASSNVTSAAAAFAKIQAIISGIQPNISGLSQNCTKCIDSLVVAKQLAQTTPSDVPSLLQQLCVQYNFTTAAACNTTYSPQGSGAVITQVLAYANISGRDGQYICYNYASAVCPQPAAVPVQTSNYITTPKPSNASVPSASGKRIKVLHLSDFHLDPRYKNGGEANCTSAGMCCRSNVYNKNSPNKVVLPATKYGGFLCDTPYDLALAALQAIPAVAGPHGEADFNFTVYTGDLVSHDPDNQLSRTYVEYVETVVFDLFRKFFGSGPIYAALGNHDTYQVADNAPNSLPDDLASREFSWDYDHLSNLWQAEGWINQTVAQSAKAHYGAYSVLVPGHNLRIITINTDFWYQTNYYNYINTTNPDVSGTLKFLADELAGSESRGERVWIVGHVLAGWSGSNALPDPTNLFYAIVNRYAPATIANIFWGHTHEDQFSIFYSGNGSVQSLQTAIATAWIGPSVTPLTGLNSGFRIYEVDTGDYNIYEAFTYYSNVSTFAAQEAAGKGITYAFEYSTREAYDPANAWPKSAPLNATFWHAQTENLATVPGLMQNFTRYQGKTSVKTIQNCTTQACITAKICYMRSGSAALGQKCPSGYSSVQNTSA